MLFKTIKQWFGPKVCGELFAQLLEEYQELELQFSRQELKTKVVVARNELMTAQILEWSSRYKRLKITIASTMTKAPSFEDYALDMEEKDEQIERLKSKIHELSFKNGELKQKLEKNNFKEKLSQWNHNGVDRDNKESSGAKYSSSAA